MELMPIQKIIPITSEIGYGCMNLGGSWDNPTVDPQSLEQAETILEFCVNNGINFFDHADIYKQGAAEQVFGHWLNQSSINRNSIVIQTKCGIRLKLQDTDTKRYDFSRDWIRHSIEQSLTRLQTDYVDIFMLHRPDPLANWAEVGRTLSELKSEGLIHYVGTSNMGAQQLELLSMHTDVPIICHQMELNLAHYQFIEQSITFNTQSPAQSFPQGLIEFCQSKGVQLQSWGSLAQGKYSNNDASHLSRLSNRDAATARQVFMLADKYQCSAEAILISWLQKVSGTIHPLIGTTSTGRIASTLEANKINLATEDWYLLLETVRGEEVP